MKNEIELKKEINPVLQSAAEIMVSNPDEFIYAGNFLKDLKSAQKKVTEFFKGMKSDAHKAWRAICDKEKSILDPIANAERTVKQKMLTFQREEERKRREEERRLQAEAEARAERERQRLLKQAEKLKTPELKEQRLQEAEMVEAPVITVQKETPAIKGISTRKIWKAEIVNKKEFLQKALDDENLMSFVEIDLKRLNKVAQATKGEINYPGIRFYQEEIMSSRGE